MVRYRFHRLRCEVRILRGSVDVGHGVIDIRLATNEGRECESDEVGTVEVGNVVHKVRNWHFSC